MAAVQIQNAMIAMDECWHTASGNGIRLGSGMMVVYVW